MQQQDDRLSQKRQQPTNRIPRKKKNPSSFFIVHLCGRGKEEGGRYKNKLYSKGNVQAKREFPQLVAKEKIVIYGKLICCFDLTDGVFYSFSFSSFRNWCVRPCLRTGVGGSKKPKMFPCFFIILWDLMTLQGSPPLLVLFFFLNPHTHLRFLVYVRDFGTR